MFITDEMLEIYQPIEMVFAYVTNPLHLPGWRENVLATTLSPFTKKVQVGSIYREQSQILGQMIETTYEVVECAPFRRFTAKSIIGVVSSLICLRFIPEAQRTKFIVHLEYDWERRFPQEKLLTINTVIQEHLQTDLRLLKKMLEHRAPEQYIY